MLTDTNMLISPSDDSDLSLNALYLALIQCFAVIICGYLSGRTHMITPREISGLNTFVGKFSLPSTIFVSLVAIDLSSVNWMFILAIFISKFIIFFLVLIITVVVSHPSNPARAGLLAIFVTQTNDFAIGAPIVAALYEKTHPEFVSYLYLLAPISLTILNPFGFVMMEIGKQPCVMHNSSDEVGNSRWQVARSVIRNIITNPIVFMTALGILCNLIFDHNPPAALMTVLNAFASAFTGTALMLLGLRMVGQVHTLHGTALMIPSLLMITKLLITPLLMRELVSLFLDSMEDKQQMYDFSRLAFLYGTLPSAPGVFVYAMAYALDVDLIAASMVMNTFMSAPWMFISAKMIAASNMKPEDVAKLLVAYEFDISAFSVVGGLLVLVVFAKKKKFDFPHRITIFLVLAQILGCANSVLKSYGLINTTELISSFSDMCASLFVASLALSLLFINVGANQTLSSVQPALIILPWGIPLCLTTILVSLYRIPELHETYKVFKTGFCIAVILFALIVSVVCCVISERNRRQHARLLSISEDEAPANISGSVNRRSVHEKSPNKYDETFDGPLITDRDSRHELNVPCSNHMQSEHSFEDEVQLLRHFVLLVLFICSFVVSLAMLLWELVTEANAGLYIEMSFIEITLRRGQALFACFVFVFDYRRVVKPSIKWLIRLYYGGEPITLPKYDSLPFETRLICDQFISQHLQKCKVDIEKTKWSSLFYGQCFSGSSLVDWLALNGVGKDSEEAGVYASKLLSGRVIRHIHNREYFYNSPSVLYTFIAGN